MNINIELYNTTVSPVAVYGCETWSITLKEEHRLVVFDNRKIRTVTGG
jgi:hypothetical protein